MHIISCKSGASLGVLYLPHRWYCICHHVHQEPHMGVLHLPSSVLHMPSSNIRSNTGVYYINHSHHVLQRPCCTSGATLACTAFAIKCVVETVMYSTSGAPLGCTAFAIKCTAYPIMLSRSLTWCTASTNWCTAYVIMYIRSLAWVYCICQQVHWIYHQVYYRGHHVHQEPHLGVLHLPLVYYRCHHLTSRVYYISHQD